MMKKSRRIFLDTSVIISAVLSKKGGSRKLFLLGEAGVLELKVGPNVLRECEEVIRRKVPASLPTLAYLLEIAKVEATGQPTSDFIPSAKRMVAYSPDAYVLAEAMTVELDWFITHDKEHFLQAELGVNLPFRIGTPGDLIQSLGEEYH